jgi:hypothetical protein
MVEIIFSREELDLLGELLEQSIEDLRAEMHETDRSQYKEMLQHRREALIEIRHKMQDERIKTIF